MCIFLTLFLPLFGRVSYFNGIIYFGAAALLGYIVYLDTVFYQINFEVGDTIFSTEDKKEENLKYFNVLDFDKQTLRVVLEESETKNMIVRKLQELSYYERKTPTF